MTYLSVCTFLDVARRRSVTLKNSKINLAQYRALLGIAMSCKDSTTKRLLSAFAKNSLDIRIVTTPTLSKFSSQYLEDTAILSNDKDTRSKIGNFLQSNTNTEDDRWRHLIVTNY